MFQGRWAQKQHIKGKPTDTGVKYYGVADPKTGYIFSFIIHNTKTVYPYEDIMGSRFALTWALLSGLAIRGSQSFLDVGHVFYFDRYYTSTELFNEMLNRKTYGVGRCLQDNVQNLAKL